MNPHLMNLTIGVVFLAVVIVFQWWQLICLGGRIQTVRREQIAAASHLEFQTRQIRDRVLSLETSVERLQDAQSSQGGSKWLL